MYLSKVPIVVISDVIWTWMITLYIYSRTVDMAIIINTLQKICGTISTLWRKVCELLQTGFYKIMVVLTLYNDSEYYIPTVNNLRA